MRVAERTRAEVSNAERLAAIKQAREGLEPGKAAFGESLTATDVGGKRASMRRSFINPEAAEAGVGGLSASEVASLKKAGYTPDVIERLCGTTKQPTSAPQGGLRMAPSHEPAPPRGSAYTSEEGFVPGEASPLYRPKETETIAQAAGRRARPLVVPAEDAAVLAQQERALRVGARLRGMESATRGARPLPGQELEFEAMAAEIRRLRRLAGLED